jgi:hypothetical protein
MKESLAIRSTHILLREGVEKIILKEIEMEIRKEAMVEIVMKIVKIKLIEETMEVIVNRLGKSRRRRHVITMKRPNTLRSIGRTRGF